MTAPSVKKIAIGACAAAGVTIQLSSYMFDGDCGVTGLMAIHISQLKEFPLYLWAAHYAGTMLSYIAAVFFYVFGISKTAVALSGILISWIWILSQYALARRVLSPAGAMAVLLLCLFPPVWILKYSMFCGGVYPETFAFSSILLFFAVCRVSSQPKSPALYYFAAGAAAGFGQWLSPGMLPAVAAALLFFAAAEKKDFWRNCLPFFAAGFVAGYAPAIVYNLQYPHASLYRMGGRLLNLDRSFLSEPHKAAVIAERIAEKIISGPRNLMKLPVSFMDAAGPLNLALLAAGVALAVKEAARRIKEKAFPESVDIALVYAALFAGFYAFVISAPAGPRYAVPLYVGVPLLFGRAFELVYSCHRKMASVVLAAVVCANLFTVFNAFNKKMPYDIDAFAAHLERIGVKYAFSDYQTAYLVTFLTKERVIISPTLFHPDFYDRYPEYTQEVRNSPEAAFIISDSVSPGRVEPAMARLKKLNISFARDSFGDFTVLSRLSRQVCPEELGQQIKI